MKFTLSWLKEHLDTQASAQEIAERLTMLGHELESLADRSAPLRDVVVGRVVACERHPKADKLSVCVVDAGSRRVQVVCGAPNARAGIKGAFAASGALIPETGQPLKPAVIRGVESGGMLLSLREMGLGEDHGGIVELPDDAPVGSPVAEAMGLDDPVFDVAITPNRGDCLGVRGLARDLAAAGVGRIKPLPLSLYRLGLLETSVFAHGLKPLATPVMPSRFPCPIGVGFEFDAQSASACPYFVGRLIRGVRNGPSPGWLQDRLNAVGLRPISALVDITNLMTLDLCRPLHVFDAAKLRGGLTVRLARPGERLAALNGREYALDPSMTVIADDDGAQSLGGVIGGEATACDDATTAVFLESALFDPIRTAATGRALGLHSDARFRFERGVDPAFVEPGAEIATRLIVQLCGGEPSDLVVAGAPPPPAPDIAFRWERVAGLTGVAIGGDEAARILVDLGFQADRSAEPWRVAPPSWRSDVSTEACLIEEVVRVAGYDRIEAAPPPAPAEPTQPRSPLQRRRGLARRALASRGMMEAVTFSFLSPAAAEAFGGGGPELTLVNPISTDLAVMRPSILANLISACGRNADRGFRDVSLFEVGPQWSGPAAEQQTVAAAGVRAGRTGKRHWAQSPRAFDAFDAKADALALLAALGAPVAKLTLTADAPPWYHPGRSGTLRLGPRIVLAHFGEVHPRALARLDARGPMVAFEAMIDEIPPAKGVGAARPLLALSPFQPIERDFAFVVDENASADAVARAVRDADDKLITEVLVFDVYAGDAIGAGRKSLAIAVTMQPVERTMTDPEIEAVCRAIVARVEAKVGGVLRS